MSIKTKSNVTYLNIGQLKARQYTHHALKRSSQRGVSETAIEYVVALTPQALSLTYEQWHINTSILLKSLVRATYDLRYIIA